MTTLGLGCTSVSIFERFRTPAWRSYRAGMFVGMGLSAVVPILHGIGIYGVEEMQDRVGMAWMLLEGFLYILGAGLYAVSYPFTWYIFQILTFTGSLARKIMARSIWHLGEFPPDLSHACSCSCYLSFVRLNEGVWLPSYHAGAQMSDQVIQ